jgi:hypothetical protein
MAAAGPNSCRVWGRDDLKPDKSPDVRGARRAADAWGVLSLDELFACGLSRTEVRTRARNGRLHSIHPGVYAIGHPNRPLEGRFLAAVKACGPTAVLSHHAAGALWGFMPWEERYPEVTVLGTARHAHPGLRIHRTTRLDLDDTTRHHGIPVTSPARTLLDLAATLDHRPLRAATRRAQSLCRVNVRQLANNPRAPRTKERRCQARPDHRHRPRAHPQRARRRRARSHAARRPRASAGQRSATPRRPPRRPGLPLARAASRRRGRRGCLA